MGPNLTESLRAPGVSVSPLSRMLQLPSCEDANFIQAIVHKEQQFLLTLNLKTFRPYLQGF